MAHILTINCGSQLQTSIIVQLVIPGHLCLVAYTTTLGLGKYEVNIPTVQTPKAVTWSFLPPSPLLDIFLQSTVRVGLIPSTVPKRVLLSSSPVFRLCPSTRIIISWLLHRLPTEANSSRDSKARIQEYHAPWIARWDANG